MDEIVFPSLIYAFPLKSDDCGSMNPMIVVCSRCTTTVYIGQYCLWIISQCHGAKFTSRLACYFPCVPGVRPATSFKLLVTFKFVNYSSKAQFLSELLEWLNTILLLAIIIDLRRTK